MHSHAYGTHIGRVHLWGVGIGSLERSCSQTTNQKQEHGGHSSVQKCDGGKGGGGGRDHEYSLVGENGYVPLWRGQEPYRVPLGGGGG